MDMNELKFFALQTENDKLKDDIKQLQNKNYILELKQNTNKQNLYYNKEEIIIILDNVIDNLNNLKDVINNMINNIE